MIVPTQGKDNTFISHGHSSSKLTSRHESRKHGVTEGRITKHGVRRSSRNKSMEKGARDFRLLTSSYISDTTPVRSTDQESKHEGRVDRNKDNPKSVVTPTKRYNELSPLMTKMVEDELKNIMINVWHNLPESAPNDTEKLIVDKLKGSAGDDIRNTIGLNITKRLLNVHNPILVKVVIYSAVEISELQAFAKKYHITDFKHVQRWTYAGRMANWTLLDDLYATKNLKCGSSSVSVSPIYSFMKYPSHLRTIFDGKQDYSTAKKMEQEAARKMKKSDGKVIITADKVLAEVAKKVIGKIDKDSDIKEVKGSTEKIKTAPTSKGKTETTQNVVMAKNTSEKPVAKKSSDNKQSATTDIVKNKITKVANDKTANVTNVIKKEKPESHSNKVETVKTVATKPVTTNTPKQYVAAPQIYATKVETGKTVAQKPVATISPKKNIAPPKTNASGANESIAISKNMASPKPNASKAETTKAAVNTPSVATNNSSKNNVSPKPNASKVEATKAAVNTPSVASNNSNKNTALPKPNANKVEATKAAVNTPSVASNNSNKNTVSPKPNASKVEATKAAVNKPSVATNNFNKNTVSPKPNASKVEATKAAVNKPSVTTNNSNKNTVSPKPNASNVEATKAAVNKPSVATKEIVSAKPNEKKPVVTAKVKLDKVPAKLVTEKPTGNSNSAKKEALPQKTGETKKPEAKSAKIEPTKTKLQPKTVSNNPVTTNIPRKETVKPKPTEYKKPNTKIVNVSAKAPVKPKINSKPSAKGKAKAENDFDELDDHDILALLSGGIVLDECSGSDEG